MNLSTLFGTRPATPAANQGQAAPPQNAQNPGPENRQNPAPQNPAPAPAADMTKAPEQGNANSNNADGKQNSSPLDKFNGLWETPTAAKSATSEFLNVDPAKMMEAVKKVDFSKAISQENLAKIAAGGQDATQAFAESMNMVAQTVMAQSLSATTKIMEQALIKQKEEFTSSLPDSIRKHTANESLRSENPLFSNPAVQPLLKGVQEQIAVKFPNATSAEINAMSKEYLQSALGTLFPQQSASDSTASNGMTKKTETDWSSFLS